MPINNSNIIVIKLNDDFISLNAAFEAIYGQNKHNIINNDIMNVSDGFINKTGSDNISAIIIYKQDFTNRALYLNPNAKKIISNDMIKKLRVKNRKE